MGVEFCWAPGGWGSKEGEGYRLSQICASNTGGCVELLRRCRGPRSEATLVADSARPVPLPPCAHDVQFCACALTTNAQDYVKFLGVYATCSSDRPSPSDTARSIATALGATSLSASRTSSTPSAARAPRRPRTRDPHGGGVAETAADGLEAAAVGALDDIEAAAPALCAKTARSRAATLHRQSLPLDDAARTALDAFRAARRALIAQRPPPPRRNPSLPPRTQPNVALRFPRFNALKLPR